MGLWPVVDKLRLCNAKLFDNQRILLLRCVLFPLIILFGRKCYVVSTGISARKHKLCIAPSLLAERVGRPVHTRFVTVFEGHSGNPVFAVGKLFAAVFDLLGVSYRIFVYKPRGVYFGFVNYKGIHHCVGRFRFPDKRRFCRNCNHICARVLRRYHKHVVFQRIWQSAAVHVQIRRVDGHKAHRLQRTVIGDFLFQITAVDARFLNNVGDGYFHRTYFESKDQRLVIVGVKRIVPRHIGRVFKRYGNFINSLRTSRQC